MTSTKIKSQILHNYTTNNLNKKHEKLKQTEIQILKHKKNHNYSFGTFFSITINR
jgi:hypothetical protein